MCIRDSSQAADHFQALDVGQADVEQHQFMAPFLRQRQAGPVSYTHLRAHETVLDLVCRLLLEKKK